MAVRNPLAQKTLAFLAAGTGFLIRSTMDWRVAYCDPTADTIHPEAVQRAVYCTWHENMMLPILMRGGRHMLAMASESGDGNIISMAMKYYSWSLTRGSSSKGGVSALLKYLRDDGRHAIITPDGPRGPRRQMSLGPVFLAAKLGLPVICVGIGWQKPLRLRSWDRFAVPMPFTRARSIFGPRQVIPAGINREALESYRHYFEKLINWLTENAQEWADSGERRVGEMPMHAGQAPRALKHWTPNDAVVLSAELTDLWKSLPGQTTTPPIAPRRAA